MGREVAMEALPKCEANYAPLTPISFLERAGALFPDRLSMVFGETRFTWAQTLKRCHRLASALRLHSVSRGDVVAVLAPNCSAVYEMHFGVPMAGAVLNAVNMRLDARISGTILRHCEAKIVFVDADFIPVVRQALEMRSAGEPSELNPYQPLLVRIGSNAEQEQSLGIVGESLEYEEFLQLGNPDGSVHWPADEWDSISINYTSGTTSHPKGVVYSHRGAYLNALTSALQWQMPIWPVYLWTLPMFHCNGWCFTWAIAALAGTNIVLKSFTAKDIYAAIAEHQVTHLCGAPVVLNMIANAESNERRPLPHKVSIITGGAPPPPSILSKMEQLGFSVTHSYGLTESYGPGLFCVWKEEWDALPLSERAVLKSRQGLPHVGLTGSEVMNPSNMTAVPRDGETLGEVMLRGNSIMKGYFKDKAATERAFEGGWFHTGDLGVMHADGYLKLKDRSKDIIISGGENISSIEVESIVFNHPDVLDAAVVARPDEFWGETPCAFVCLKESATLNSDTSSVLTKSIIDHCRKNLPHFMCPRTVVFGPLPKTITGKVQKNVLRERLKKLESTPTSRL